MIPDKFISQGILWTVRFTDDIEDLGWTDWDAQEILIRKALSPELRLATFIHEVFHTFNSTIEHSLMDSLTMQFFQVIKDNNLWKSTTVFSSADSPQTTSPTNV